MFTLRRQTTSYGAGSDGDLQKGLIRVYVDNGDGTITDTRTGLMWEKKSDDGTIHDKDNACTWGMTSAPYTMNGTMVTTFLTGLNNGTGFARHTDWRSPNLFELESLRGMGRVGRAVSPAFNTACDPGCTVLMLTCSCTASEYYWSSTTYADYLLSAWGVDFDNGHPYADYKGYGRYVRAGRLLMDHSGM